MANVLLCHNNRADAAVLSGGSWNVSAPITNMQTLRVREFARTADATLASTLFAVDLGASYSLRAVALVGHNISTAGTVRVRTSNVSAAAAIASPNYNSGFFAAKRLTFYGDTPVTWGNQYQAFDAFNAVTARYLYIEVSDAANADGYIQIGRLFIGGGFQTTKNISMGFKDGRRDLSTVMESPTGTQYSIDQPRPRNVGISFDWLTQAEADRIHELQAEVGKTGEIFYVPDPADLALSQRYGFLGYMSDLSPLEYPHLNTRAVGFQLKEKL